MASPTSFNTAGFSEFFASESIVFIGRSSFEPRAFTAFSALSSRNILLKHFFVSIDEYPESYQTRVAQEFERSDWSELDTSDPLHIQSEIASVISKVNDIEDDFSLIVDCTTFRREEILILLRLIRQIRPDILKKCKFVYSVATRMGDWLSGNIREVRPVLGYPGDISSRSPTHLVLLAGIEHHRAIGIIDAYEPSTISLGMVPEEHSFSSSIYQRNLNLRDYIKAQYDNVIQEFEFSARDPHTVIRALEEIVSSRQDDNIVIAPLNTKISTIGAGVFSIIHPKVQLCYADVDVYNSRDYSEAGDEILMIPYDTLF